MSGESLWLHGPVKAFLLPVGADGMEVSGVVRGLGLTYHGLDVAGEGMGIGGAVLRLHGRTYFPLSHKDTLQEGSAVRKLELNGLSRRYLGPLDVTTLHRRIRERLTPTYLGGGNASSLFRLLMKIRSHLLKTRYVKVETAELCEVRYTFSEDTIKVRVLRERGCGTLIVANELSGELFDCVVLDGRATEPGPWSRIKHRSPTLASKKLGLDIQFLFPEGFEVFAGREFQPPRLNWSGVDIALDEGVKEAEYTVKISCKTSR